MCNIYIAGRINIDTIIELSDVFIRGRKYRGRLISKCIGGSGANIAIAIARFNRGFRLKLIATIGSDHAEYIVSVLASEGIDTSCLSIYGKSSGEAYVFIDKNREATIVTIPNANEYPPDPGRYINIDRMDAVVLANTTRETALNLIDIANRKGATIFLDPGVSWFRVDDLANIENECFILPNRYEFIEIFGFDIDVHPQNLRNLETRCSIIVKLGAEGAIAIDRRSGKIIRVSPLNLEGLGLDAKTTAGCGDVFTGVFVAKYLEDKSILSAIEYASIAAGLKRSRISSSDAPTRDEIEKALVSVRRKNLINMIISEI
ncbi:MAG: carbohydrate kinase family protein [Ignisphaera sp.]